MHFHVTVMSLDTIDESSMVSPWDWRGDWDLVGEGGGTELREGRGEGGATITEKTLLCLCVSAYMNTRARNWAQTERKERRP